jgi:hypothetical protein
MSSNGPKPWYVRAAEMSDPREREEFIRGIGGAKTNTFGHDLLLALVAGYVGGKIAQRGGDKK